jgi:hypothetical protein
MFSKLRYIFAGLIMTLALFGANDLKASQGSACLPLTGVIDGVDYTTNINAALAALLSSNSGGTVPANGCGAAPAGQVWLDTRGAFPIWRVQDGTVALGMGAIDSTNHVWMPNIGGGIATMASAATDDLCSIPQSSISISGTTPITSFGSSCGIGQAKFLNFSGVTTITYGISTILLPTSASITTKAGDQAIALYTGGGVWRLADYTRADGSPLLTTTLPSIHFAGEVIHMRIPTCPLGSVPEDGAAISRTANPALFAAYGTNWGIGDGVTTFNVPDSRGYVDRNWGSGASVDPGRVFYTTQADQIQTFSVNVLSVVEGGSGSGGFQNSGGGAFALTSLVTGNRATSAAISGRFGSETRMTNITVWNCDWTGNLP